MSTHYKLYNNLDMLTHLMDLLDKDGCSYIGPRLLQSSKLVIPTKGIMISVSRKNNFKSKEAYYSKSLASPLLAS